MITLSARDEARVLEIIGDWEASGVAPRLVFYIGDKDYSDAIPDGDVKQDGIAISMDATLAPLKGSGLPLKLSGAPMVLSVDIDGILIPLMRGLISVADSNEDNATTKLTAASAGSLADKYPLNEKVQYPGDPPYFVVRDALRRLPYIPGGVDVENVGGPLLSFADGGAEEPFSKEQTVNDILSKVQEKVPYVFRDTAEGGHKAFVSAGLATIPEIPDHMRFHAEELLAWKSPSLTIEQYSKVIVDKTGQQGESIFGDNPPFADITYIGRDYPPLAGYVFRIEWTGDSQGAQQHAYDKAREFQRGLYKNAPTLPYNPLIERTDPFMVTEAKEEDEGGFFEREWLHYIDAYEQPWGDGFATKPTCRVTLADEQFVKSPTLILSLISQGNKKPLWGRDGQGIYVEDEVPWAWVETEEVPGTPAVPGLYPSESLYPSEALYPSDDIPETPATVREYLYLDVENSGGIVTRDGDEELVIH